MYTIELDVDPVTLGFDPKEITRKDYEQHHIVFWKSAPTSPYEDPFLPEKFREMLNNS